MNLKLLSDQQLLADVQSLVRQENEILTSILHHLREIERRRLYCILRYGSLFEYATKHLLYSEDQACRRISAMRLLKQMPEIEKDIASGDLSLTNLGLAQSLFRKVEMTAEKKSEVLEKMKGQSKREAEKIVAELSPEPVVHERARPVAPDWVELKILVGTALVEKLEELKGLLAHSHPNISTGELLDKLSDLGLEKWRKGKTARPQKNRFQDEHAGDGRSTASAAQARAGTPSGDAFAKGREESGGSPAPARVNSRIRVSIRRQVFQKYENKCARCSSRYALEIDHITPRAFGGTDDLNNLRVLCRKCNQRAAIEQMGLPFMENYFGHGG